MKLMILVLLAALMMACPVVVGAADNIGPNSGVQNTGTINGGIHDFAAGGNATGGSVGNVTGNSGSISGGDALAVAEQAQKQKQKQDQEQQQGQQQGQGQQQKSVNKNENENKNKNTLSNVNNPSQNIQFGDNVNLIQLPGILGTPTNFSQPYLPKAFLNDGSPIRPASLTRQQADECAGGFWGYSTDYDGKKADATNAITLVYPAWDKVAVQTDASQYVGTISATGKDKPWLPTLCKAALEAMDHGADFAVVEHIVRPKNVMSGIGFGGSAGASGMPSGVSAAHPYAIAGVLGFGTGKSSMKVEGEVLLQLTGLRQVAAKKAEVAPSRTPAPPAPTTSSPPVKPAPAVAPAPASSGACAGAVDPTTGKQNFAPCK